MATLELNPEELKALWETIERRVSDLAIEVGHTDSHDFRKVLKEKKAVLDCVLAKLRGVAAVAA